MTSVRATGCNLLTVTGGGARASVRSAGAFGGNGVFNATVSSGSFATGPLLGSLRVKLTGVPVISITGDNAMLLNANGASR